MPGRLTLLSTGYHGPRSIVGAIPMSEEIRVTVLRYPDRKNLVLAYVDPVSGKRILNPLGKPCFPRERCGFSIGCYLKWY